MAVAGFSGCHPTVAEVFPAGCTVAYCESTNRPDAVNGQFLGLFQISPTYHHGKLLRLYAAGAVANLDYFDPHTNTILAADITGGGRDWSQFECKP